MRGKAAAAWTSFPFKQKGSRAVVEEIKHIEAAMRVLLDTEKITSYSTRRLHGQTVRATPHRWMDQNDPARQPFGTPPSIISAVWERAFGPE